jgi:hypothetical protein
MQPAARGGIAGCLVGSIPAYIYGEITGYWLAWSSLHAPERNRMSAAVDFIASQWSGRQPAPTRLGAPSDWRNRAVFSFDLAIMVRGLAAAAPIVGTDRCGDAADRLGRWLDRMVDADGSLRSHVRVADGELPDRWSTRPGAYQAKAAAALLRAPDGWLSRPLLAAAERALAIDGRQAAAHRELHPRFYALEGLLLAGRTIEPATVSAAAGHEATFPGELGGRSFRSDVVGQALRLLCALPDSDHRQIGAVVDALLRHVRDDGSLAFRQGEPDANVWCALFAHQALDWACDRLGGETVDTARASQII